MELWIRSQNRKMLTKIDYLYLEPNEGREILGGNHYMINRTLGTYVTKERALEILEDIQKIIQPRGIIKQDKKGIELTMSDFPYVYKMPIE